MNYQSPKIERIALDQSISLQLTSLDQPPGEADDWVVLSAADAPHTAHPVASS